MLKPQVLKNIGGVIQLESTRTRKLQVGRISIVHGSGSELTTPVTDAAVSCITSEYSLDAASGFAQTADRRKVSLASTSGIEVGQAYLIENKAGQSEVIRVRKVVSADYISVAEEMRYDYDTTTTADKIRRDRALYQITPVVASLDEFAVEADYRATWELIFSDNATVAVAGSSTSAILVLNANSTGAVVGRRVTVYLGATYGYEERVILSVSAGATNTTVTVSGDFSEAVAASDPVYFDSEHHIEDMLFDCVPRYIYPPLTVDEFVHVRWPGVQEYEYVEQTGTDYLDQYNAAWEDLLEDIKRLGYEPHRMMEATRLKRPFLSKLKLALGEEGIFPSYVPEGSQMDFMDKLQERYDQELTASMNIVSWYDENDDALKDEGEEKAIGQARWGR